MCVLSSSIWANPWPNRLASSRKYLRRDLRRVAKQTQKFPRKYTQLVKKLHIQCFIDLGWLAKRWTETCVDLRSNLISTKVSTSQRKCTQGLAKRRRNVTIGFSCNTVNFGLNGHLNRQLGESNSWRALLGCGNGNSSRFPGTRGSTSMVFTTDVKEEA